ncbi:MAG: flagellar motor stator protein MotA [Candidatus Eremiobacterota bacterium]
MLIVVGCVIVLATVMGGYAMHHGPFGILWQPSEFVIIGGAAIGATVVMAPMPILKKLVRGLVQSFKGSANRKSYLALLVTLYRLIKVAAYQGANGLEPHVERPEESDILSANKELMKDHHALEFFCDTVKVIIIGGVPEHQIAELVDVSMETHAHESEEPVQVLTRVADSLPGLGIVAAVLGIIITMQHINGSPEEIGHSVGAALVGTFLGVLAAYGFLGPLAANLEFRSRESHHMYNCMRGCVLAYARGFHPLVCAEFGRRTLPSHLRPSFQQLEQACREEGKTP